MTGPWDQKACKRAGDRPMTHLLESRNQRRPYGEESSRRHVSKEKGKSVHKAQAWVVKAAAAGNVDRDCLKREDRGASRKHASHG